MQAQPRTILCELGGNRAIRPQQEAIFVASQKCLYHVTFDLERDLEHNLGAGPPVDLRDKVWWRSSHVPARRSNFYDMTKVTISRDL